MLTGQPLLVLLTLWQKVQVCASLRCPAWNVGLTPRAAWQLLHFAVSVMRRRPVKPVATFQTFGAGTLRPPTPPTPPFTVAALTLYGYAAKLIWVSGIVV